MLSVDVGGIAVIVGVPREVRRGERRIVDPGYHVRERRAGQGNLADKQESLSQPAAVVGRKIHFRHVVVR
jgi:hypothetical protein